MLLKGNITTSVYIKAKFNQMLNLSSHITNANTLISNCFVKTMGKKRTLYFHIGLRIKFQKYCNPSLLKKQARIKWEEIIQS